MGATRSRNGWRAGCFWLMIALTTMKSPLTHEFLGVMLGTARPGVTIALQELERRGWITHRRGAVTIIDRKGLVRSSNGAYLTRTTGDSVGFLTMFAVETAHSAGLVFHRLGVAAFATSRHQLHCSDGGARVDWPAQGA